MRHEKDIKTLLLLMLLLLLLLLLLFCNTIFIHEQISNISTTNLHFILFQFNLNLNPIVKQKFR
jgi:hypothetical protein